MSENKWVLWANALSAIAQNGLLFSKDPFDKERYKSIQALSAEIITEHTNMKNEQILDIFCNEKGYATPKLDVRGAVFKNNKILLVRERSDNAWTLPGGWADINESPAEAVIREINEETGFETKAVKLIALYDKHKHNHPPQIPHAYKAIFLCEISGGFPRESIETNEISFFDFDNLPSLSLHRILSSQIKRAFEHKMNVHLPTDFD